MESKERLGNAGMHSIAKRVGNVYWVVLGISELGRLSLENTTQVYREKS